MPVVETKGSATSQGYGQITGGSPQANYIEDVFSTYLYTGNGTSQTITNNIDLSTKGGLVWCKNRAANTFGSEAHEWYDTVRGTGYGIFSNSTSAQQNFGSSRGVTAFSTTGFTVTNSSSLIGPNSNGITEVGWTFAKQAKFFDVVTFTSSASGNKTFSHNLGSVPGCVIIKNTQTSDPWLVYHRSTGDNAYLLLNRTDASSPNASSFSVTSTTVTVNTNLMYNSQNYVAYLFAHDAGGFGTAGTDNVISCGSYTGNGSNNGPVVTLGYEPQFVIIKRATDVPADWQLVDSMRGMPVGSGDARLRPNGTYAESSGDNFISPTATGFQITFSGADYNASGATYIYIAIRRPMKPPTTGTEVYNAITYSGSGSDVTKDLGFVADAALTMPRTFSGFTAWDRFMSSRLTGNRSLITNDTSSEGTGNVKNWGVSQTEVDIYANYVNTSGFTYVLEAFRRAPTFFDVVCYTGTGTYGTQAHNLTVVPQLAITKRRDSTSEWATDYVPTPTTDVYLNLNTTAAGISGTATYSSTVFQKQLDTSGATYVTYLFATCAGVSKVGSYTGTGTTQQINCGFTGGARFVLIKRTDSTGDWYVWDSARGIVAGNDPYLLLNSTAAETTNTDYVDTYAAGFEITSTAPSGINANGGSYIYLAIA